MHKLSQHNLYVKCSISNRFWVILFAARYGLKVRESIRPGNLTSAAPNRPTVWNGFDFFFFAGRVEFWSGWFQLLRVRSFFDWVFFFFFLTGRVRANTIFQNKNQNIILHEKLYVWLWKTFYKFIYLNIK